MTLTKSLLALCAAGLISLAAAHATVRTEAGLSESAAGKTDIYRLNVPTEQDQPTTQIRLMVPNGVAISRFQVTPGFTRTVTKNAAGLVIEVVWTGEVAPMEYARFYFQATNPAAAGELVWKIYQTYRGGTVVAWDDTDPAAGPASKTTVK